MRLFLIFLSFIATNTLFAVTYTKSSAGNYTSGTGWSPSYPGTTISSGDVVIINAAVTLDDDIKVEGTLTINSGASLSGNKEIEEVKAGGVLTVNGTLDINKIDKIKGTATFNGTVEVDDKMKIEDNGTVTIGSSGSYDGDEIEVKDDGVLNVNGSLILDDKLKVKDDATVDFNNGSTGNIKDIELEDDGEIDVKAGSDVTVTNDLKVKDDGKLTVGGTITVEDDIEFEDDAVINISGVLNLCDDDGTEDNNKFEVDEDVDFSGDGTFCQCNTNDDNDYDNNSNTQGSITFDQNCNGPLPIELIEFNAEPISEQNIEIKWVTASEINNASFHLEFSVDGKNWELVSRLEGAGTSNKKKKYATTHDILNLNAKTLYYRVKNIDYDGRFAYSWIISVELPEQEDLTNGSKELSLINLYPNPAQSRANIIIETNKSELIESVAFISVDGKTTQVSWVEIDRTKIELNVLELKVGLYKVLINSSAGQVISTLQIN